MKRMVSYWESDFATRKRYAPDEVISIPARGWEYIPVHPFGDDEALLRSLAMEPSMCWKVDCWWKAGNIVALLQAESQKNSPNFSRGFYGRWNDAHRYPLLNLFAVVEEDVITRDIVYSCMIEFANRGVFTTSILDKILVGSLSPIPVV